MTGLDTYSTPTRAMLFHGGSGRWMPTPLTMSYDIGDPAAVRLGLVTLGKSWHVARSRLAEGLCESALETFDHDSEAAADVYCGSMDITGRTLIGLRARSGIRYVMTINTDALRRFLGVTYHMCSCWREEELVAAGIESQLATLAATQEGQQS